MIETVVAIAIAIATQTGSGAEALVQRAKAAITSVRMVRGPVERRARKNVGCGAVELTKAEADAEFARRVLVWPGSIDQELLARQMLVSAESQKRAVLALCAPSTVVRPRANTVVRPRANLEPRASPFEDDPFDQDREDRRPADIDLDKTTVRMDGIEWRD